MTSLNNFTPINVEFDGSCVMWATMALARMNRIVPHHLVITTSVYPFRFREALNALCKAFSKADLEPVGDEFNASSREGMLLELMLASHSYYENTPASRAQQNEFKYLLEIFEKFHRKVDSNASEHDSGPYGSFDMLRAIASKVKGLTKQLISDMCIKLQTITEHYASDQDALKEELNDFEKVHVDLICVQIEQFIQQQVDLKTHGNYDPIGIVGAMFVQLIREPLHEHVESKFASFLDDLGVRNGNTFDKDSNANKASLRSFFTNTARFFSYETPLLNTFWDDDEDVPEHVANRDFAQYDDGDWYSRQYALVDTQDVLRGAEDADVDDVSVIVPTTEELSCGICDDCSPAMRRLNCCPHVFCEECLGEQLEAEHECRYRCALCRAEFFPQSPE